MRPIIKFKYGKARCPLCVADHGSRKQYESVREIRSHLNVDHSYGSVYFYTISSTPTIKGNYPFTVHGSCSCGCGEAVRFPTLTATILYMPSHSPPYYLSGHKSSILPPNSGMFEKGNTPWNKDTKGVCKPNSGSFKKGNIPPQERGGHYTAPNGQEYEWTGEYHPGCGVRIYRARSRRVMEKKLGRELLKAEVVIHLDEKPGNDDPNNLKLITRAENATRNRWKGHTASPKVKKQKKVKKESKVEQVAKYTKLERTAELVKLKVYVKPVESAKRSASPFCPKCGTLMLPKSPCPRC